MADSYAELLISAHTLDAPETAKGRAAATLAELAVESTAAGRPVVLRRVETPEDFTVLARKAVEAGIPRVLAAGGDGSLNRTIQGLLQQQKQGICPTTLGIIPLGTANDFARGVLIPLTVEESFALALAGDPQPVDVLAVNDQFCLNVATGGFGAHATRSADSQIKKALGGAAYLYEGLKHLLAHVPEQATITGPDFEWSGEYRVVAFGNGMRAGGGWPVCPNASIDDGLLDVLIMPADVAVTELIGSFLSSTATLAARQLMGSVDPDLGPIQFLMQTHPDLYISRQLPKVVMEASEPIALNLDGERVESCSFDIRVQPGALRIALPSFASLLRGD